MTATTASPKPARRRSPNRQRLVARVAVWAVALSAAGFFLPRLLGA